MNTVYIYGFLCDNNHDTNQFRNHNALNFFTHILWREKARVTNLAYFQLHNRLHSTNFGVSKFKICITMVLEKYGIQPVKTKIQGRTNEIDKIASQPGWMDSTFACQVGSTRLNLTAAQVSNPPWPTRYWLHEGCLEGKPSVYTSYSVHPYWWKRQVTWGIAPDMTLRFTVCKQVRAQTGFETHGEGHSKSKMPHKMDLRPTKI